MPQAKRALKGKRRNKAAPVLGIAGVSLAMAGGAASASAVGSVADMPSHNPAPRGVITLGEEEISDVSLSTFFVFDKEHAGAARFGEKVAYRGCRGCRGCAVVRGCRGCGGCGCGCCQSQGRCRYC
jgi:lambda family phage tail tape measure protein